MSKEILIGFLSILFAITLVYLTENKTAQQEENHSIHKDGPGIIIFQVVIYSIIIYYLISHFIGNADKPEHTGILTINEFREYFAIFSSESSKFRL